MNYEFIVIWMTDYDRRVMYTVPKKLKGDELFIFLRHKLEDDGIHYSSVLSETTLDNEFDARKLIGDRMWREMKIIKKKIKAELKLMRLPFEEIDFSEKQLINLAVVKMLKT